jgi:uncharacterized protein (DUF2141 family)
MIARLITLVSSLLLLSGAANASPPTAAISITISKLRTDQGYVSCRLFDSAKGFPIEESEAAQVKSALITKAESRISFTLIPEGIYAIACFHDENGNGKYDLGLFGIPLEGSVASRDAKGLFGPPSFSDAKFSYIGIPIELRLKMIY